MVAIDGFWYKLHARDVPKACRRGILDSDTVLPSRAEAQGGKTVETVNGRRNRSNLPHVCTQLAPYCRRER